MYCIAAPMLPFNLVPASSSGMCGPKTVGRRWRVRGLPVDGVIAPLYQHRHIQDAMAVDEAFEMAEQLANMTNELLQIAAVDCGQLEQYLQSAQGMLHSPQLNEMMEFVTTGSSRLPSTQSSRSRR